MRRSNDPQKGLGAALHELREAQGATQAAIAMKAELTFDHYCAVEQGYGNPTWPTMRRLAHAFGISVAELAKRAEAQADRK